MILALLVSLVCFTDPAVPVQVAVVKHLSVSENYEVVAGDAQCCDCPCWNDGPPPYTTCGCSIVLSGCSFCGYQNIVEYGVPWGPFVNSDVDGCVDMDLLPIPQDGWVYWVN